MLSSQSKHLRRLVLALILLLAAASLLAACNKDKDKEQAAEPTAVVEPEPGGEAGIANPASVYCEEQGGALDIRTDADGNEFGVCVFADGSECEEWAFFRGECAPGQASQPEPEQPAAPSSDELAASVQATLPEGAFEGVAGLELEVTEGQPPLWAAHSTGLRSFDIDPLPSHFIAIYSYGDSGWQEEGRVELDQAIPAGQAGEISGPDWLGEGSVEQVQIDPTLIWLQAAGGVGAHSGAYQLLSFDGASFTSQVAGFSPSPGAGRVADVNGDGVDDVMLDASDPYIFCYACGVRKPGFQVYTWLNDTMLPVNISVMLMGQQGQPWYEPNSEAVALAEAGLWPDSLAKIEETRQLVGEEDPPTGAGSFSWNEALIKLNHDANQEAIGESAYPLLNKVFLGDYAGAVDLMREYSVDEIFSPETPLIVGTAAEGWEDAVSNNILSSANAAIAVRPELAGAFFLRAWAQFLADPGSRQIRVDLRQAADLAPADELFSEAASFNPAPSPRTAPTSTPSRVQFAPGGVSAQVGGGLLAGNYHDYILQAQEGQTLDARVDSPSGDVVLSVTGADGTVLLSADEGLSEWSGALPATQDYTVRVTATGERGTSFMLTIAIPPLP